MFFRKVIEYSPDSGGKKDKSEYHTVEEPCRESEKPSCIIRQTQTEQIPPENLCGKEKHNCDDLIDAFSIYPVYALVEPSHPPHGNT